MNINQTVEDLHFILIVPKDKARPLRLYHPSFRDFHLDNNRCLEPSLWVEKKQAH
ncbi:hypothetical protein P152DRAFT_460494 [Eremomyces bilateralis CBS 781.70]|uniref:Uncharacterized protein n=1 Tax=Eremomyces bilateralis CBS 781.70 TaxID=1392243 RepID=A0A6G1FXQ3_9PEZI|nr:uncharacterized protein P152DRAFT_460494 [Eremomyces bilateralis CBS 781.70]KAF1810379.1 hypothetical protein P152DRAFT_460494 [Eremomyces bilateralis CBS 781.70]